MDVHDGWDHHARAFGARWRPGCPVEVVDRREVRPDEAWVCLRAGSEECVIGLRRRRDGRDRRVDVLYVFPEEPPVARAPCAVEDA